VGCGREDGQQKYVFYLGCCFQCYYLNYQASDCSQLLLLADEFPLARWEKSHYSTGLFFPNPSTRTVGPLEQKDT